MLPFGKTKLRRDFTSLGKLGGKVLINHRKLFSLWWGRLWVVSRWNVFNVKISSFLKRVSLCWRLSWAADELERNSWNVCNFNKQATRIHCEFSSPVTSPALILFAWQIALVNILRELKQLRRQLGCVDEIEIPYNWKLSRFQTLGFFVW